MCAKLLKEKAGLEYDEGRQSLADTLQELFRIFFPGKSFEGPVPTPGRKFRLSSFSSRGWAS